jgi:twitching motility protein PilT
MAAPSIAPISVALEGFSGSGRVATPALLGAMLRAAEKISDLIFSPGRPPQVQVYGQMIPVQVPGLTFLTPDDTRHIAADLIGDNKQAITTLREHGACDISFGLPGLARFRVNIFIQRGSCAVVMRVIPTAIPDFAYLRMPQQLSEVTKLRDGIVLVTGPAGSGKSSTLAVLLDAINREKYYHIITIEDPIEFLHNHKCSTIHQRELHSDTPSFAHALRSAMRQAPKVILVGEMRDRETIEIVLEAAETGHLVFSSLNTMDASKTVERVVSSFSQPEQQSVRERFAKSFRYIICQRLMSKADRGGRIPAFEILKANARTRECVEKGERENKSLLDAMKAGASEGMQHFDGEIAQLLHGRLIDLETGLSYASNPATLGQELAR